MQALGPANPSDGDPNRLGGCTLPTGQSFYGLSNDGSNSNGYSFFTSSMWAVSEFDVTNGVGAGTVNRTCYRYQDAMLSDWGRGFQGFRSITAEEQFALADGENSAGAPTGCIAGSKPSTGPQ